MTASNRRMGTGWLGALISVFDLSGMGHRVMVTRLKFSDQSVHPVNTNKLFRSLHLFKIDFSPFYVRQTITAAENSCCGKFGESRHVFWGLLEFKNGRIEWDL